MVYDRRGGGSGLFISVFFLKIDLNREAPYVWCLFFDFVFLSKIRGYVSGVSLCVGVGGGSGLLNSPAVHMGGVFFWEFSLSKIRENVSEWIHLSRTITRSSCHVLFLTLPRPSRPTNTFLPLPKFCLFLTKKNDGPICCGLSTEIDDIELIYCPSKWL